MRDKNLPNLPDLLQTAIDSGARLVACTMSMEAMGIREEELIDGIELGGVAEFLGASSKSGTNLFI
jgi:peroxiredoxin family protein